MEGRDTWRSPILQHFSEASALASRLTVVSDPDELLAEPGVAERLSARGFELMSLGDPVEFRYAYESRFRQGWDRGEVRHLVLVVRSDRGALTQIPHDLLEEAREGGRVLSFGLTRVFPSLAPSVVAELDRLDFNALGQAIDQANPGNLGLNATRDFVLRHVFEVAPELVKQPADLLRILLRRHYRAQTLPRSLDDRFIEILLQDPRWQSWPLERIIPNRDAFLTFVSERWPIFLISKGLEVIPGRELAEPSIAGPTELPFEHDDIRVYMDNYFVEGLIEPTAAVRYAGGDRWFSVGILGSPASSAKGRFDHLLDELRVTIPSSENATHQDWQAFSLRWGTWVRLRWQTITDRGDSREADAEALAAKVQGAFSAWLLRHFAPMTTLPFLPRPVLGHQIPQYLAYSLGQAGEERVALLVIDGMAIDQWRILRDTFGDHSIDEHAIFSWVPTLTNVSRQAIFSGRLPFEFAKSIESTGSEAKHWKDFWESSQLASRSIQYVAPQGAGESTSSVMARIRDGASEHVKVLGGVIGFVDQSLHHAGRGTRGLHAVVQEWADSGELSKLVDDLIERGFSVFVTADHGNVFSRGFGKPDVGVTAQQRGVRAHIFRDRALRDRSASQYPSAVEWPQTGLPHDYFPLIAPYGACFLPEGRQAVSHGGITLEEVMVPFVRIERAK